MENSSIIIYQTEDGNTKIETHLEDETMSTLLEKSEIPIFYMKPTNYLITL